jgi:hypothetical protein
MKRQKRRLHLLPAALAALLLVATAPGSRAETPFSVADIFFELNDTDGDLGIHALIDGEPWRQLELESPDGREKLRVTASGTLRYHGLTELFFESAEPPFDELPPRVFFRRFPEGKWEISGITIDERELESTDTLRHVLPAPPEGVTLSGVEAAEDCDVVPLPSVAEPVVIAWDPVTKSHPELGKTGSIKVVRYQVVIEREEPPLTFSVELPPDVTEFEVPEGLTDSGDEIKFEILVRETTGNQTAIESCFEVE